MNEKPFFHPFILFLSLAILAMAGCGPAQSKVESVVEKISPKAMVKKVLPKKATLKKRAMVLPVIDQAGFGAQEGEAITRNLVNLLLDSPAVLLFEPPKSLANPLGNKTPKFGIIIPSPTLIKKADQLGMNAVITGVLNPVEATDKETGIWPFKSHKRFYEISMVINVVGVTSGTLLLSNLESEEESLPLADVEGRDQTKIIQQRLKEPLRRILKRQAEAIEDELREKPWTGKILAVENQTIRINAGSDVGLTPGQSFAVFAPGETISAKDGQTIDLLGTRVGEIKVQSVMKREAFATPVEEGGFLPGQVIRFNP